MKYNKQDLVSAVYALTDQPLVIFVIIYLIVRHSV